MDFRIGLHFMRRRILNAARRFGGAAHSSMFRCARGFEAMAEMPPGDGISFHIWNEHEPAEEFIRRVDVLLGVPDIRLLTAREHSRHRPPYLAMVMGDATRAVPWPDAYMQRLQATDTVVCSCTADRDILRTFLASPTELSVDVAPMPIDSTQFAPGRPPPESLTEALARFGKSRPVILSADRMRLQKGLHHIVALTNWLRGAGHEPLLVFLNAVIGEGKSWYQAELEARLDRASLGECAVFLPHLSADDMWPTYARAAFVVSASTIYDNNFGYVPVESQFAGTPPIVADWGGYHDIVVDGQTGLHMPTVLQSDGTVQVDWQPAAEAAHLLLSNPQEYRRIVQAGWIHVQQQFSLKAVRQRYCSLALLALARDNADIPEWRINQLGATAIAVGWTDQSDTPDRAGRRRWRRCGTAEDYDYIHNLVYSKYVTNTKARISK
jgi:glycosyltransferase involved in cell wall biosynthesis